MKRLKVLMSAYACEPGKGSEPGVGWNIAKEMAKHHDIWVLTRANNRGVIEAELEREPVAGLRFVYFDLPRWARWWKRGGRGVQLYYYLWQLGASFTARRLHRTTGFDVAHHVTFAKYWAPSCLAFVGAPYVWGPVGGGESAPRSFWAGFSPHGRRYERVRAIARWFAGCDPLLHLTARRSAVAVAATEDTRARLKALGVQGAHVLTQVGLNMQELPSADPERVNAPPVRFVSVGNLLHWKGFHLGLSAFARAGLREAEYWIVGDGPERARLESLAQDLGIRQHMRFLGELRRSEAIQELSQCDVLVHPSLHDSGGFVCLEAMAVGKPVLCLALGGPAVQVTSASGFRIQTHDPEQTIEEMADAMERLASDAALRSRMGAAGQRHVREALSWAHKGKVLDSYYAEAVHGRCAPVERAAAEQVH